MNEKGRRERRKGGKRRRKEGKREEKGREKGGKMEEKRRKRGGEREEKGRRKGEFRQKIAHVFLLSHWWLLLFVWCTTYRIGRWCYTPRQVHNCHTVYHIHHSHIAFRHSLEYNLRMNSIKKFSEFTYLTTKILLSFKDEHLMYLISKKSGMSCMKCLVLKKILKFLQVFVVCRCDTTQFPRFFWLL